MEERIKKIQGALTSDECFIISSELHNFYLTGFNSTDGAVVVTSNKTYLLVDSRYIEAASSAVKHCEVICFSKLFEEICKLIKENNITKAYFERENISLKEADMYKEKLDAQGIKAIFDEKLDKLLLDTRLCKSKQELEKIQKAQEITEQAFMKALDKLYEGMTERELALTIEFEMKRLGAQDVAFDLIAISGKKTSMPHGEPDDNIIRNGDFITMDIGAVYQGYHSDMTRTIGLSFIDEKMRDVYNIVLKAQLAALEQIKPGVSTKDVDKAARDVIADAGYGEYFKHSTGHGVGIQIHEQPGVSPNTDVILKEGMVITVEPGIYLPGEFGVRIEDMVCVTKDGYRNFTTVPKILLVKATDSE